MKSSTEVKGIPWMVIVVLQITLYTYTTEIPLSEDLGKVYVWQTLTCYDSIWSILFTIWACWLIIGSHHFVSALHHNMHAQPYCRWELNLYCELLVTLLSLNHWIISPWVNFCKALPVLLSTSGLINISKKGKNAFVSSGFKKWKKAKEWLRNMNNLKYIVYENLLCNYPCYLTLITVLNGFMFSKTMLSELDRLLHTYLTD